MHTEYLNTFIARMKDRGQPESIIDTFSKYYKKVVSGKKGLIFNRDIIPVNSSEVKGLDDLQEYADAGRGAFARTVQIVLNGGLGTSMGLSGPKLLIKARNNQSFLQIIIDRAKHYGLKPALMNSPNTHEKTLSEVEKISGSDPPVMFLQHQFPKILRDGFAPALYPVNPELEWNPPGHGDIYAALEESGTLQKLLDAGIIYAFICNLDNLGSTPDASLLGYFAQNQFPFMMEVAEKTQADVKGGHLARLKKDGRLIIREVAQCPEHELKAFQNIDVYRFFNTNNIWINLKNLKLIMQKRCTNGLPMILNPKYINPRDDNSPEVYQIETAMGSAISFFEDSTIVKVPRTRFVPVKKCSDLLAIRSDCFVFSKQDQLIPNPKRKIPPVKIELDPKYYGKIDDFDKRFAQSVPSLIQCEALSVTGDVCFEQGIAIKGKVRITNPTNSQRVITKGTVIDRDLCFQ
jgi:UTP--glucose-1-phosphate uridylyltransferase